ncbi:MAG: acyltransferase [Planctomycetaceae bacterium]|nr:acyltransferase [Planctomycetaceae bacterium]
MATADAANTGAEGRCSPREYRTLDAWRGIAALWVVLYHATADWRQAPEIRHGAGWLLDVVSEYGWLGVQLFFVISGYCIAATADSCRRKDHGASLYCKRRFVRIFPTYAVWLLLLSGALLAAEWLWPDAAIWTRKSHFSSIRSMHPIEWLSNLALVQTWLPRLCGLETINVTAVGWTLCYEVQFYAVVAAIIVIAPRQLFGASALVTAAMLMLFAVLPTLHWMRYVDGMFLDGRWIQFATGIGVYYALVHASPSGRRIVLALLAALTAGCFWQTGSEFVMRDKRIFEIGFCSAFAILLVVLKPGELRWSGLRPVSLLSAIGVWSYSLYLVHWPFCKITASFAWRAGLRSTAATWMLTVPVCVVLSLLAAAVYFRCVERRFLNAPLRMASLEPANSNAPAVTARVPDPAGA